MAQAKAVDWINRRLDTACRRFWPAPVRLSKTTRRLARRAMVLAAAEPPQSPKPPQPGQGSNLSWFRRECRPLWRHAQRPCELSLRGWHLRLPGRRHAGHADTLCHLVSATGLASVPAPGRMTLPPPDSRSYLRRPAQVHQRHLGSSVVTSSTPVAARVRRSMC